MEELEQLRFAGCGIVTGIKAPRLAREHTWPACFITLQCWPAGLAGVLERDVAEFDDSVWGRGNSNARH